MFIPIHSLYLKSFKCFFFNQFFSFVTYLRLHNCRISFHFSIFHGLFRQSTGYINNKIFDETFCPICRTGLLFKISLYCNINVFSSFLHVQQLFCHCSCLASKCFLSRDKIKSKAVFLIVSYRRHSIKFYVAKDSNSIYVRCFSDII